MDTRHHGGLDWERLPKSELHVHLAGAMPVPVFTRLLNRHGGTLVQRLPERHRALFERYPNIRPFLTGRDWTPAAVAALFEYDDFDQFLATFTFTGYCLRTIDDFAELVEGVLDAYAAQNIVYAEIIISAPEHVRQGIALADLVACLDTAARRERPRVQWIIDPVRDFGPAAALALVEQIIALKSDSIVGITLGGSEHHHPPDQFTAVYALARASGLRLTVHAGEALGPSSVWQALGLLGVERIGHGVRAIEDPALVQHLAEHGVPLEVCPTSNLRTGLYRSYTEHPVRALVEAGVVVTLNSDDPTFFGATLAEEYRRLAVLGLSETQLLTIARNGFRHAFLPASERRRWLDEFDRLVATREGGKKDG